MNMNAMNRTRWLHPGEDSGKKGHSRRACHDPRNIDRDRNHGTWIRDNLQLSGGAGRPSTRLLFRPSSWMQPTWHRERSPRSGKRQLGRSGKAGPVGEPAIFEWTAFTNRMKNTADAIGTSGDRLEETNGAGKTNGSRLEKITDSRKAF
jgi:hypothetical protein